MRGPQWAVSLSILLPLTLPFFQPCTGMTAAKIPSLPFVCVGGSFMRELKPLSATSIRVRRFLRWFLFAVFVACGAIAIGLWREPARARTLDSQKAHPVQQP